MDISPLKLLIRHGFFSVGYTDNSVVVPQPSTAGALLLQDGVSFMLHQNGTDKLIKQAT